MNPHTLFTGSNVLPPLLVHCRSLAVSSYLNMHLKEILSLKNLKELARSPDKEALTSLARHRFNAA